MARGTDVQREDRREAAKAVAEAKRAGKEAGKLAKTLSRDARASFEAVTAPAQADVRTARNVLGASPARAAWLARRAAAQLELASARATASGDAERKALADSEAKRRAKELKRRRVQVQQAHKMAEFVALHVIMASFTTPTDREQAEADLKLAQRLGARTGRFGRP